MAIDLERRLADLLESRLAPERAAWLAAALEDPGLVEIARLRRLFAAAPRLAGRGPLGRGEEERRSLADALDGLDVGGWEIEDVVRAALLLRAGRVAPERFADLARALYDGSDAGEQRSWLRALPMFPEPQRFLPFAIEACRTNVVPLFESIACENPYPARWFPERNFNQLVLKALFNRIAVARVQGLVTRFNEELARMSDDYVSELEAAGRPVPPDIWFVLVPRGRPEALARADRYRTHVDPAHGRWVEAGLQHRLDAQ